VLLYLQLQYLQLQTVADQLLLLQLAKQQRAGCVLLLLLHLLLLSLLKAVQQTLLRCQLHWTPLQQAPPLPPSGSLHHQCQLAGLPPLLLWGQTAAAQLAALLCQQHQHCRRCC
jgi:hypothetical protein